MNRAPLPAIVALLLTGLPACRREAAPTPEARVLAAVANVVTVPSSAGVCCFAGSAGPLMIDVGSFAARAPEAFGAPVSKRQVEASLRRPHRDVRQGDAIRCTRVIRARCRVWHDGVYVRMDSVTRGGAGGFSAFVTTVWPHRGLLGMAHLRVDVRRRGAGWHVSQPTLEWIT